MKIHNKLHNSTVSTLT